MSLKCAVGNTHIHTITLQSDSSWHKQIRPLWCPRSLVSIAEARPAAAVLLMLSSDTVAATAAADGASGDADALNN